MVLVSGDYCNSEAPCWVLTAGQSCIRSEDEWTLEVRGSGSDRG